MTRAEMTEIELQMKEQRVMYWETHHALPGCREMIDYLDYVLATI